MTAVSTDRQDFAGIRKGLPSFFDGHSLFNDVHKAEWEELADENSHYYADSIDSTWVIDELIRIKTNAPLDITTNQQGELMQTTLQNKLSTYHKKNHPKVSLKLKIRFVFLRSCHSLCEGMVENRCIHGRK